MQNHVLDNFAKNRDSLIEALRCEDYEEQGILDLDQLVEAINTVKEDIDASVLSYMLYFVFIRSQDFDNLEYKYLIELINDLYERHSSRKSSEGKNRAESSGLEH